MTSGSEWQPDRVQRIAWAMVAAMVAAALVLLIGVVSIMVSLGDADTDWFLTGWGAVAVALSALTAYAAHTTRQSFGTDAAKRWGITTGVALSLLGLLTLGAAWGFFLVVLGLVVLVLTLTPNA